MNSSDIMSFKKLISDCSMINSILETLHSIPDQYKHKYENCNAETATYEDDNVKQIKPSTHPVFYLKKYNLVIKILQEVERAYHEEEARHFLKDSFPVFPVCIVSHQGYFAVLMPYIKGSIMLSALADTDIKSFLVEYDYFQRRCIDYIIKNSLREKHAIDRIQYPGKSLEYMLSDLSVIKKQMNTTVIVSSVTGVRYSISDLMDEINEVLLKESLSVCLFTGDINLHNVLFTQQQCYFIDFEHFGYYDTSFLLAKVWGTLFLHCNIFSDQNCIKNNDEILVSYRYKNETKNCVDLLADELLRMNSTINQERVLAFMLARMYYRFFDMFQGNTDNATRITAILDVFKK